MTSDKHPIKAIGAAIRQAGLAMPVLLDAADALQGRLSVRVWPTVGFVGKTHTVIQGSFESSSLAFSTMTGYWSPMPKFLSTRRTPLTTTVSDTDAWSWVVTIRS